MNSLEVMGRKDIIKFCDSYSINKKLKFFANLIDEKMQQFSLFLKVGGSTYTDFKDVFIGIPEYMEGETKEVLFSICKALIGHEVSHKNYTPKEKYGGFIEEFSLYFKDKYKLGKNKTKEVGAFIINSIEDGRIERLLSLNYPGIISDLILMRGFWWREQPIKDNNNELFDTLFCITTIATMGILPEDYTKHYNYTNENIINNIKLYCSKAVNCNSFSDCLKYAWELVYSIEDWLVAELLKLPEQEDLIDLNKGFSKIGENIDGSMNKYEECEEENIENNIHGAFKSDDKKQELGESTDKLESSTNDENRANDFDLKELVDKIIEESKDFLYKESNSAIIQAEKEDILKKEKDKKDELDAKDSLSQEKMKDIENYYNELFKDKHFRFKDNLNVINYNYEKVSATGDILIESKKLKKELSKIIIDQVKINPKNKKRGLLDTNAIWKIQNKQYDIFKKRYYDNKKNHAFYVLVDGSGSMTGEKFKEAYKATAILEDALSEFVALKIAQFNVTYNINHHIIKNFNEKKSNKSLAFLKNNKAEGCNMDGYSIRVALEELKERNENKKILIILSDGLPYVNGLYGDKLALDDVKCAIRDGRRDGILIFNIMFGSKKERESLANKFLYMYEKSIVSCEPYKIPTELLRIAKRELLK
ncbi:VWA domain-containing protein [Clostridioides difficile]|nr:VWA domain-containing protein [Clostridioides difficile]